MQTFPYQVSAKWKSISASAENVSYSLKIYSYSINSELTMHDTILKLLFSLVIDEWYHKQSCISPSSLTAIKITNKLILFKCSLENFTHDCLPGLIFLITDDKRISIDCLL